MKRSKKYQKAARLTDRSKDYKLEEAIELLPEISISSFESSVELHINLNLTGKQKKETIKGNITLPHKVGEPAKVAVITTSEYASKAKSADFVGGEDLIKKIQKGWSDFDVIIATPEIMPKIAVLGKILGPKGKMPNQKNQTVTTDIKKAIDSYKKGKIDFRADEQGSIHQVVGKVNMKKEQILENITTFISAVKQEVKGIKGDPFKSAYLSPSMGPSIKLDLKGLFS